MRLRIIPFLVLFFMQYARAQIYPVSISAQLAPPYSGYLTDYAEPSTEKLSLILQLNDFSVAQHSVKLKLEIKGNGYTLSTKTFFNPPPILLYPGQPLLISSADLAPYLSSNNLDFSGINQAQYETKKSLPEGYYSICVTAYDYYSNNKIQLSNSACVQAWFTLSDPPFLNFPVCNSEIKPLTPQNVLFQWTPMNQGSPNSALNTEYEFALWECRPDSNVNPNQLVLGAQPIFSTTTQQSFLNYGITEPTLNLYMKYVWRVRAKDISGRDCFKNNGYSQICTFKYGTANNVLGNSLNLVLNASGVSHRTGMCEWNKQSIYKDYLLQVRKKGTAYWFDYANTSGFEKISNLEPNTSYECRVRGEGNGLKGEWSNTASFKTQAPPVYNCNDQTNPYNNAVPQPLPFIKALPGLIIQTGQFEVLVTTIEASGSPGWYKGRGYVRTFGKKILVKWDNIYIDAEARHQQGIIEALTDGVEKWMEQWDMLVAEQNATYVNGEIDSVFVKGGQACYTLKGSNTVICVPTPTSSNLMAVRDGEGNQYVIKLVPLPAAVSGPDSYIKFAPDSLDAGDNAMVTFEASANQNGGFDKKMYAGFILNYEAIKLKSGKNYFVPNKSISVNVNDEVLANVQVKNFNPALLSFKTLNNSELPFTSNSPGIYKITGIPPDAGSIYAWYDSKKVGKLKVYGFKNNTRKLVLVPVNGAGLTGGTQQLQSDLNAIYKQSNTSWNVSTASSFTFDLGNDGLEAADAGHLCKYSSEMRRLRDAFRNADTNYVKDAYYIFIVSSFSNPSLKGYMARGRAAGFITAGAGAVDLAHELGHGAFGLQHSFPKIEQGSSNNLMDYAGGTQLVFEQWVKTHETPGKLNWMDEEEDGSGIITNNTASGVFYWINNIKVAYKKSQQLNIPSNTTLIGRVKNAYLAGIQYDSIAVYVRNSVAETKADVKDKISIMPSLTTEIGMYPLKNYSVIAVDGGKVTIHVPMNRVLNMKTYLEANSTFKNLMLFVNGYRPIVNFNGDPMNVLLAEYKDSENIVEMGDSRGYWKGIDAQFMNRIGTRQAAYADGHHSVMTSNHETVVKYTQANLVSVLMKLRCDKDVDIAHCKTWDKSYLNTVPNVFGFFKRANSGKIAARDLMDKISSGNIIFNKETDTIDVVAHSMGYAYSVGMISELAKNNFHFGRCYIVAPENACTAGDDWSLFHEVWQYGSNLGEPNEDEPWNQDGVAPQCAVGGIDRLPAGTKGGRVFIPKDWQPKGFLDCHTIANYGWIFQIQNIPGKQGDGYVKPRK